MRLHKIYFCFHDMFNTFVLLLKLMKINFVILFFFFFNIFFSFSQKSSLEENMILVEGGTFMMGQDNPDIACKGCTQDEQPIHRVTLNSYYIGKYEVTQKEWNDIMNDNPNYEEDCSNCPVEGISWIDIQEFIKKLNSKTGKIFRLPTEAEWEFAAKGGIKSQKFAYSGSNVVADVSWSSLKKDKKIHSVGQKKPNELGIYDMSGNVWEWCNDLYDGNYYTISPTVNPTGPTIGKDRVLRGGAFYSQSNDIRVTARYRFFPTFKTNANGFRLAMSVI